MQNDYGIRKRNVFLVFLADERVFLTSPNIDRFQNEDLNVKP